MWANLRQSTNNNYKKYILFYIRIVYIFILITNQHIFLKTSMNRIYSCLGSMVSNCIDAFALSRCQNF